jgi:hypothetical protein
MAAIGNSPTQQAFTPAIDYFSGNGSTTAFTLSRPVASVAQVQVTIDNVAQNPSSAYTVSANTITFTSAPLSGTNNIYVYYTSPITQVIAPGQSTVGLTAFSATGTPSASTYLRGDNSWGAIAANAISNGTSNVTIAASNGAITAATAGTTAVTIDTSQNVLIATTNAITGITGVQLTASNTSENPAYINIFRDDTTIGNGQFLGYLQFCGRDATSSLGTAHAYVAAVAEADHGAGDNATAITFGTTPDNSSTMAERMRITSGGNLQFNSGYGSVATAYGCRAWVTFNGTGTVAITGSANVSSITDGGTGIYTVNFTNSMPDANYATVTGGSRSGSSSNLGSIQTTDSPATGSVGIWTFSASALIDWVEVNVSIFR